MRDDALAWTLKDLTEVNEVQEATVRGMPHDEAQRACPKLGTYHDDRYLVLAEIQRRDARAADVARRVHSLGA